MPRSSISIAGSVLSLALAATLLFGCAARLPRYVDEGGRYTLAGVNALAKGTATSEVADLRPSQAREARRKTLVELRKRGKEAGLLADYLTTGFPPDTASVPVLVERADVEGVGAWIVVEAWATGNGKLTHRRVWVFERSGGKLRHSASFR